jgi:Protein of unknown function (DUF1064)
MSKGIDPKSLGPAAQRQISAALFAVRERQTQRQERKYGNIPITVDGVRFDSKAEAARWGQLRLLELKGDITRLQRQVPFPLIVNGVTIAHYIADFVYWEEGKRVVEDVKSPATARNPCYRLKKKLIRALLGIEIVEVEA